MQQQQQQSRGSDPCRVHVVLFLPAGVRETAACRARVDEVVACGESFLRRWGHDDRVTPFRRGADGRAAGVTVVRGRQAAARYRPVELRAEVMDGLRRQKRVESPGAGRHVWWILVYPGDPPARFDGFLGGFGPRIGGWGVCNLDTTPGRLDPDAPLDAPLAEKVALKGMLHELGHGFGLPHVGPLAADRGGNTLMGPTHANYRRVGGGGGGGSGVYLSEAEAALLSVHPAFRGAPDDRRSALPKPAVRDLEYRADPERRALVVRGRVSSPGHDRPVYALVADESDARPGEYWTKTYVGRVSPADGAFSVTVSEPYAAGGTLRTWFAFADGAHTGDGRGRGRESGIPRAYAYRRGGGGAVPWSFP